MVHTNAKTLPSLTTCLFLAIGLLTLVGCGPSVPQTRFQHESGMSFDFPEGWSVPGRQEWNDLQLGEDNTLVTVMDESRSAMFSIVPVQLGPDEEFVLNLLDDNPTARAVMFVESIDAAGPQRYGQYELIGKNPANFAGAMMGEIVFEGSVPGKDVKWRRLLALTTMSDAVIMFIFAAPPDRLDEFQPDFDYIESTWRWDG